MWSRLSQLTKEEAIIHNQQSIEFYSRTSNPANGDYSRTNGSNAKTQLVRSTTFTLNSNNPKLKERNQDMELEDISLESYIEQNESNKTFGFGFLQDSLNDPDTEGSHDVENIKRVAESLMFVKKELLKQQSDLKVTLTNWRKMKSKTSFK